MATDPSLVTEARKLRYQQLQENRRAAGNLQAEYGRWLIASLLLVHGASILLLAQSPARVADILPVVYWWHIAGLILAFVCGFLAWMNCGYFIALYDDVSPEMIYNDESWPKFDQAVLTKINLTFRGSVIAGMMSVGCLLGAAIAAYRHMVP
ncbi:hypothetical protein OOJ09_31505 [Mesorhizobium qingshengii]|uniref:Uncharacterized protein n=1 Tax=Mesorhizobium qingshengii TaxID=1165689 RepID=A0ABT4R4M5_9HYPH|nr:hypothetical protein [Mesorhizobium qingshengii]MCZ8548704.1 hypothetical protein [Mesorhizobium qingshengii]